MEVRCAGGRLAASVQDDGRGFELDGVLGSQEEHTGRGLRGISERMALLGGSSRIVTRPGQGTLVALELPLPAPEAG